MRIFIKAIFAFIKRNKTGRKSIASTVISALLAMFLLGTAMTPAFLFADYKGREVTGSYKLAQTEAILVDESREETFENDGSKREVPVHFYYPENEPEHLYIMCHEVTSEVREIIHFVKSLQGTIIGDLEDKQYEIQMPDILYVEAVDN